MKQKTGIILLLAVLLFTWACTPSSLLKNKNDKESGKTAMGRLEEARNKVTPLLPTIPKMTDPVEADTVGKLISEMADSAMNGNYGAVADSIRKEVSQMADSLDKETEETKDIALLPDTAKMDSLQLAIWKHNKAIDDSLRLDSLNRQRKNGIDSPVDFSASDSLIYEAGSGMAHLFGNAQVKYQNMDLKSEIIYMSLDSSLVHATGAIDSTTHELKGTPVFQMGSDTYESDTMAFNFKTKKGLIQQVYTQQDDGYLTSELSKRGSNGELYLQHGKYTTCDDPHPDFYLALSRAKVRPGKDVVFGPAYLVVCDVPVPLAVPYGFFPFSKSYSSGFIMPTYGDESDKGFYLRDGGYYFAFSDYFDLKLIGEIYTKGSWGISTATNYKKRYKYSGTFFGSFQNSITGDKNMPDYVKETSFKIQWSHRQDPKANPYSTLTASVNYSSTSYDSNNLTSMYNPQTRTQSTRTSSIAYSTGFSSIGMSIQSGMNLAQNMRDSSLAVTLPDLTISISRFYPFKRKKAIGKERWYEKISLQYTGSFSNSINTKEKEFFKKNLYKDWNNGMKHTIPISANFSVLNYLNLTPTFNFSDVTYTKKVLQSWDQLKNSVVKDTLNGFYNVYNWNLTMGVNTTLYGMYVPSRKIFGDKIIGIRHVLKPQINFTYAPNFSTSRYGYYETYQKTNADGSVSLVEYFPYVGSFSNQPSKSMSGTISVDLSNNIEMKLRNDNDTAGPKKISIIDELGLRMSYNLATDVKPLSNLDTRLRLKLTKSYTFNLNATFSSYVYECDSVGGDIRESDHTTYWQQGKIGRFQGLSQNLSYTLDNTKVSNFFKWLRGEKRSKKDEKDKNREEEEFDTGTETNLDTTMEAAKHGAKSESKADTDEDGYMDYGLGWSLSFGYGITMRENTDKSKFNYTKMRYPYKFTQNLNISGNLRLSEGWNISFSSGYDFEYKKISMTTASLSRDLHCFNMSCSVVLAPYTSYNFSFRCNASTLTDALKYDKRSGGTNSVRWY